MTVLFKGKLNKISHYLFFCCVLFFFSFSFYCYLRIYFENKLYQNRTYGSLYKRCKVQPYIPKMLSGFLLTAQDRIYRLFTLIKKKKRILAYSYLECYGLHTMKMYLIQNKQFSKWLSEDM